jgi:RHS repeat-associated protein
VVFNEIGQVWNKQLHSTDSVNFLQTVAYTYNERGWLTGSNAALFSMQLLYNTGTNKQYNGNIAYQTWLEPGVSNSFTYAYDNLNRLTGGYSADNYIENAINYDLNGNLTTLARYRANAAIDFLNYSYASGGNPTNQLQSMADYCSDTSHYGYRPGTYSSYQYDANGNMTVMPTPPDGTALANINIQYNLLNLPQAITGGRNITYTYDATGNKLRKVSVAGQTTTATDYISGIQYKNNGAAIDFIQTEEGKVVQVSPGVYDYYYYLGDNLGNTRVTFDTQSGSATVQQQDDYYPFGLEINRNVNGTKNEYLYNRKELQEELGQYDYGARFYDPVIGRWQGIDNKAELYFQITPYAYAANNPASAVDRDGRLVIFVAGQNFGDGGGPSYWDGFDTKIREHFHDSNEWYYDHGIHEPTGYVGTTDLEGAVNGSLYIDGGLGGWSNTINHWGTTPSNLNVDDRLAAGYEHSGIDIGTLINSLKRTNGVITESIKIVAHSLGAAYARGLISAIVEYAKAHPEECQGLSITEYDFAAFQQNELPAPEQGVTLYQFDNVGDNVVDGFVGSANNSHHAHEKGRDEKGSNDNVNPKGGHSITDFLKAVSTLAPGKYKYVNGQFIKVGDN